MSNKELKKNDFSQMEEEVLDFWDKARTFERSVKKEAPQGDFVFYDGPPFATGLPHYGHLVGNVIKDVVPRYWTMKGYRVERKWGWDCHGLPLENLAEQELELKNKADIENIGIDKFNQYCQSIVLRYSKEWEKIVRRLARWVDMENDYRTMDPDYMESIWWVFKTLWEKGLIYKGHKSMHICPRCGTTLSNFEVGLGYIDIKDLAVTAKFELKTEPGVFLLAWTTTPWTLIGNVALAVGSDMEYVKFKLLPGGNFPEGSYIASKEYFESLKEQLGQDMVSELDRIKGRELVGMVYKPLFDYYAGDPSLSGRDKAWQVYGADFVSTEEGTGLVHIAPAFGEDDLALGEEHGLPFIQHIDKEGKFKEEVRDFSGLEVKPKGDHQRSDILIIKYLAHKGGLFHKEKYEHSYPHCWRCDTPLLNYATDSWFVKVTGIKEDLVANNQNINWVPAHLKDGRFGKWLEQARDWAISRDRYWGAPLPVWECQSCGQREVLGSRKELEEKSGEKVEDLHKQHLDNITFTCEECQGNMKRVSEVLDCWFESGSMPYAQFHYPFENKNKFENNFPAEFVAEGIDQTRGWFYTLMVLSSALFGREAFKNVVVNGIVLAENGAKMSKSKKNYPDPCFVFDAYSVDAVRYYFLSSSVVTGEDLNFSEQGVKEVLRKTSMTLWNVYKFYSLFAQKQEEVKARGGQSNVLDRWIISRLEETNQEVSQNLDDYILPKAARPLGDFIDDLSTWYLRRSRDRFKGEDEQDKQEALETTKYVLLELSKLMAPFMPFLSERLWQEVSGNKFKKDDKSVHLQDWPSRKDLNQELLSKMKKVREVVEVGLAKRDESGIKVRQPLAKLKVAGPDLGLGEEYLHLIKEELNLKEVEVEERQGDLEVVLDTNLTPELIQEGIKRELVRLINNMRKDLGLSISDRISVSWQAEDKDLVAAVTNFSEDIRKETLSKEVKQEEKSEADLVKEFKVNDSLIKICVSHISVPK